MTDTEKEDVIDRKERMKLTSDGVLYRSPEERIKDFDEIVIPLSADQAMYEASRCIQCPDPAPCVRACPADNNIPEALKLIEQGKFVEAAAVYRITSSMPEICGRVCPHDEMCQGSCVRSKRGETVLTGSIEAFVADYARAEGDYQIPVGEPSGKRVAIIGAGPSGLSCAEQLVRKGHHVNIFETMPAPGGLLIYGIPNFKLPNDIVSNVINDLETAGVEFTYDTYIGRDKTIDDLLSNGFDAAFIGVGSQVDAPLKAPGVDLPGVYQATEFLMRANVDSSLLPKDKGTLPEVGDKLVVIGGGDTASDCLRSAIRLGAKEVTCLYRRTENEMPGGKKDREITQEEGANYQFLTQPIRFIAGENGHLAEIECIRMELGEPDESGRRRPIPVEGTEFIVQADTAILALGYWPDPILGETTPDLETHKWGLIITDPETGTTSRPGVYAGGDAVTGPDLVVTAMVAGRKAAATIDEYLNNS